MKFFKHSVCFTILFLFAYFRITQAIDLRGVHHKNLSLYEGERFRCFDQSQDFNSSVINDDYCDCNDGSDEPGTEHCAQGQFQCENKNQRGKYVPSSRVNDGICDCCDGSDEQRLAGSNAKKCPNTCMELRQNILGTKNHLLKEALTGNMKRANLVKMAINLRQSKQKELDVKRAEFNFQNNVVDSLKAEKEKLEKIESKERERRKKEEDLKHKQQEEQAETKDDQLKNNAKATVKENSVHKESQVHNTENKKERKKKKSFPFPKQYQFPQKESEGKVEEMNFDEQNSMLFDSNMDSSEHNERLFSILNILMSDYLGSNGVDARVFRLRDGRQDRARLEFVYNQECNEYFSKHLEDPTERKKLLNRNGHQDSQKVQEYIQHNEENIYENSLAEPEEDKEQRSDDSEEGSDNVQSKSQEQETKEEQYVDENAEKARKKYEDENSKLEQIKQQVNDLESFLTRDYGSQDELMTLANRCFDIKFSKYKYEMCPFQNAAQIENGQSISLGNFEKIEFMNEDTNDDAAKYRLSMTFSDGQSCQNGPARSCKVLFKCSSQHDRIISVSEPSKCSYLMEFETISVCNEKLVDMLSQEISEIETSLE